jgi:hypothetical protein
MKRRYNYINKFSRLIEDLIENREFKLITPKILILMIYSKISKIKK